MRHLALALIALTLLLLCIVATADGDPAPGESEEEVAICMEAAPDSGATVPTIERVSWSEIKAAATTAPVPEADDD